jgi:acyl-lipid omega-6 desaturase (Delta-12 desaturase)
VPSINRFKLEKRAMILRHARSDNVKGITQVATTLALLALLWLIALRGDAVSRCITSAAILVLTFLCLRVFALMHECGHGSLFRNRRLNRIFGFALGVIVGMPQYVWSRHHNYHHAHNGNWDKYRGPYTTLSVDEYAALSHTRQRLYRGKCSIAAAPLAGFVYLIFNPRFTWARGTLGLLIHLAGGKFARPSVSLREHACRYETRCWTSPKEYWHMFWNNVVLLGAWALMCWAFGTALFFTVYLVSLSLAGGVGILLFTVQHNFEHAYASDGRRWNYDTGALAGTSFLILPRWLNWCTVNIAYHHVHHLSSSIPNYRLVGCHADYQHLFSDVRRVRLSQIPGALKCILWDTRAQRIISVAEYLRQSRVPVCG